MQAIAKLRNLSFSPRKVRLVANLVRGKTASQGLALLKHVPKRCAVSIEKLLLSAVTNWSLRYPETAVETAHLRISSIWVDNAGMLKRIKPAPQGRAHRIRRRSSHVTLVVEGEVPRMKSDGQALLVNQSDHGSEN